ncbi:hypothetical protein SM11_pC0745 (plasmid) [Sinorhizobium meliloti SM11]|uniref:Uncharacterized protein n=1 Tax=Sinorhizobium meliloti (strain SM11) TaxID=707241 RepID=F7XE43_SINMM|nr:hypothetical protein SM11_pC0745 [Sinorhizobium meliloti SM11]
MPISGSDWVQIEAPADHCAAATGVTSERSSDSLAAPPGNHAIAAQVSWIEVPVSPLQVTRL